MQKTLLLFAAISVCGLLMGCGGSQPDHLKSSGESAEVSSSEDAETSAAQDAEESEEEDYSVKSDRIISKVYGDDFHMAYSMEDVVGTVDEEKFLCEYSKLDIKLNSNCILLEQETGDGSERNIKYEIDAAEGECVLTYDTEEGDSTELWRGTGKGTCTTKIILGNGAGCLRLAAIDGYSRVKLKITVTE